MTIKRVVLGVLTVLAIFFIGQNLVASWSQPQFNNQLELVQTNLVLQASEWQGDDPNLASAKKTLLGTEPLKASVEQYQTFRQSVEQNLQQAQTASVAEPKPTPTSVAGLEQVRTELGLKLGILQAAQGQVDLAQKTWATAIQQSGSEPALESLSKTVAVLAGLWSTPPRLLPDAESRLKQQLDGWFRYRSLSQLYQLQQRQSDLAALKAEERATAEQAFNRLVIVGGVPAIGSIIGVAALLFLVGQWLIRRKQALLDPSGITAWSTPWDWETVWQVLIFGFFFVGQILLPLGLSLLGQTIGFDSATLTERSRAFYILINYLLLAAGAVAVLYGSIKSYLPLPEGWFRVSLRGNWFWWGTIGYVAALPLVSLVSIVNQQIWQGKGGSNPILPIALEGKDSVALTIFFVTAAIAAPVFEEILFRGFLLPSLTRYLPMWGAIGLSGLIFAIAHLSLSEVLPLTVLGMVLGFVYVRSRNLLASMLLHSLWNSVTLLSLIVLGGSAR